MKPRADHLLRIFSVLATLAAAALAGSCAHRGEPFEPIHVNPIDSTKVGGGDYGHWVRKKSPYYVIKSVVVPQGKTLIIEPGVTVIFTMPGQNLTVNGTLIAVGKAARDSAITFVPTYKTNAPYRTAGDRGSLILTATSRRSRLAYVKILYATTAIQAKDMDDSLTVENSEIKFTMTSGIELTRSNMVLRNSQISLSGDHGVHLIECEDPLNRVVIDHCNIGSNWLSGIFSSGSSVLVMRSDIENNGAAVLRSPDLGISAGGAHFEGTPGIQLPTFIMCNIQYNTPCDMRNIMPGDLTITADSTYWGPVTTSQMNLFSNGPTPDDPNKRNCSFDVEAICDGHDTGGLATVHFCWWRDQAWPREPNFPYGAPEFRFAAHAARWR